MILNKNSINVVKNRMNITNNQINKPEDQGKSFFKTEQKYKEKYKIENGEWTQDS